METYYDSSTTANTSTPSPYPPRVGGMDAERREPALLPEPMSSLGSYASVGQLSYAPATQTTVVTTTTTTTTSFPPILFKNPRNLLDRDPKQYPLAATPTPTSIRKFCFDLGGRPAYFEEGDDVQATVQEFQKQQTALKTGNGTIRSVTNTNPKFETPKNFPTHHPPPVQPLRTIPQAVTANSKKRAASPPVSLAEAAEIASLQRRNKKLRPSLLAQSGLVKREVSAANDENSPFTPERQVGSSEKYKVPTPRRSRRSPAQAEASSAAAYQTSAKAGDSGRQSYCSAVAEPPITGVSATPPIAENDLEPVGPYEAVQAQPLNTLSLPQSSLVAQDASLPSPSLSPITAAANLANATRFPGFLSNADVDEDSMSSLDISQDVVQSVARGNLQDRRPLSSRKRLDIAGPVGLESNPQLLTPTLMDVPSMLDSFDAMPNEVQTYVMYQLLRRCAKPTLHFVADVVNPALKCDFLGLLPPELSMNIVKRLDVKSMCRAAQVSKKWRQVIDSDEKAWKDLLDRDGFVMPQGEVERAVREGWGWQIPDRSDGHERDLSKWSIPQSDTESSSPRSTSAAAMTDMDAPATPVNNNKKRKAAGRTSSNKKRKTKPSSSRTRAPDWAKQLEDAQGPIAHANAAIVAIPNPRIGVPSLQNMHLYKSIYHRHRAIRDSWMDEDMEPHHQAFQAHGTHVVTCLQFDSDKILTGSDDTKINVFDTKTGALRRTLDGHEGGVWALQYDGNLLVSGSTDRSVRVWDIETGRCLQIFQGHTSTVRCLVILKPSVVGEDADGFPIVMPKEPLVITGSRDSTLRVWRLPQIGEASVFQTSANANDLENPYFVRVLNGHLHSVRAIAAHGDTLVSGSYDHTVRVWRISTGEVTQRLVGHSQKVYSVVLDHKRNRCISGSMDNLVKVWSLDNGTCLFNLEGHSSLVGLLDLSHDRLVSAAADSTLRIWDPDNGQCKSTLTAHTGAITCFQHDSQKVISGSDRTLKMWNVKTGECVRDLLTDLSGVWQVKFNERRCVAAVQRDHWTYIEVLDFGATRDGVPREKRGKRTFVDKFGHEAEDFAHNAEDTNAS